MCCLTSPRTLALTVAVAVLTTAIGCTPPDPTPQQARNLGSHDRPLLPTPPLDYDRSILNGRASPVLAADVPEEEPAEPASARADAGEVAAGAPVSDQDRELIEELLELVVRSVAGKKFDELSEYIVPQQRESVTRLVRAGSSLAQASVEFGTVLQEKAPDAVEQLAATFSGMAGGMPGVDPASISALSPGSEDAELDIDQLVQMVKVRDLSMAGENKAGGIVGEAGQALPLEFELLDEEWYLRLPAALVDPELVSGFVELAALVEGKLGDLSERLEDGSLAPEPADLMQAFMASVQELQPALAELAPKLEQLRAELSEASRPALPEGTEATDDEREQIVELVELWSEALADRNTDDLIDLLVPDERDRARDVYDQLVRLLTALDSLIETVENEDADSGEQLRALGGQLGPVATVEGLRKIDADTAAAVTTVDGQAVRSEFVLVDDQWYFRDPGVSADQDAVEAKTRALGEAVEQVDALGGEVEDGTLSPPEVAPRLRSILVDLGLISPPAEAPETAEAQEEEEPPPDEEEEEEEEQPPAPPRPRGGQPEIS